MNSIPPWPVKAVVVSQDPDNYGLNVMIEGIGGGQMPTLPVKVLTHGPRDGVRGLYPELPLAGTHGLVVFPRGDYRNGHWLGATDPALNDSNSLAPGVGNSSYSAHYGGGISYRSMNGAFAEEFPDGSALLVGFAAVPVPTRHTVTSGGIRQRTPFPAAMRRTTTPDAFPLSFAQPTGASVALTTSGGWTLIAAEGQPLTLAVSGGAVAVLGADGSAAIQVSGGATLLLAADGSASLTLAVGKVLAVSAGGLTKAVKLADGTNSTTLVAQ